MPSLPDKSRLSGFTLIELLVALTILGGLMAVTYSGFRVALTMWEKGNQRVEAFAEQQTTLEILRGQIRGALPMFYLGQEQLQQQHLAFEGQADRLRFVSRGSWRDGANAIPHWVELRWDTGSDARLGLRFIVDEKQIIPPSNLASEEATWHSELTLFEDLQFSYLSRRTSERQAEWVAFWDASERREFPAAIQLKYRIQNQWNVLLIPLDYAETSRQGQLFQ